MPRLLIIFCAFLVLQACREPYHELTMDQNLVVSGTIMVAPEVPLAEEKVELYLIYTESSTARFLEVRSYGRVTTDREGDFRIEYPMNNKFGSGAYPACTEILDEWLELPTGLALQWGGVTIFSCYPVRRDVQGTWYLTRNANLRVELETEGNATYEESDTFFIDYPPTDTASPYYAVIDRRPVCAIPWTEISDGAFEYDGVLHNGVYEGWAAEKRAEEVVKTAMGRADFQSETGTFAEFLSRRRGIPFSDTIACVVP